MKLLDGVALLVLSLILLTPFVLPVVAGAPSTNSPLEMDQEQPENCIPSPRATSTYSGDPAVMVGEVSSVGENRSRVRIEFNRIPNRSIPEGSIQLRFGKFANVTDTKGFDKQSEGVYNWDRTSKPWVEYRIQKPVLGQKQINLTNRSKAWEVVPLPTYGGAVQVSFEPAQQGYLGSRFAYLGEYETQSIQAGCQKITLIIPEQANLIAPPDRLLQVLNETAYRLPVGQAYNQVRVFIYPGNLGDVGGFVRGTEYGVDAGPEIVIQDNASLNGPQDFTWRHEYIHTRQSFGLTGEMEWFREASANYYAYRVALDSGAISPRQYDAVLARSYQQNFSQSLAEGSDSEVAYQWGPVVLSRVDATIRSSGNQTLLDVFRWMNQVDSESEEISLTNLRNQTVKEALRGNSSENPRFNLTRSVTISDPPLPSYITGPKWLPNWVRPLWYPTSATASMLWLLHKFVAILWLVIAGSLVAEQLGYTRSD